MADLTVKTHTRKKNECGKMRDKSNPYQIWKSYNNDWEWRVLKTYQTPDNEVKNEYARWFCFVTSPFCPDGEYGDTYIREIKRYAYKVQICKSCDKPCSEKAELKYVCMNEGRV